MQKKYLNITLAMLLLAIALVNTTGYADRQSRVYVQDSLQRSLSAYALARGLNAIISVMQGTEVAVEPMGMGVTFTPGEILDPLNDLVERFSWIVLTSATLFGIQNIMLDFSAWLPGIWLLNVLLLSSSIIFCQQGISAYIKRLIVKLTLLLVFIRFSVPLIFVLNQWFYLEFLQNQYQVSSEIMLQHQTELKDLAEPLIEDDGSVNTMQRMQQLLRAPQALPDALQQLKKQAANLAESITKAIIDMLVVFIVQTLLLPLAAFYAVYRLLLAILKRPL